MPADCAAARAVAYEVIREPGTAPAPRAAAGEVDGALTHIMRCAACRAEVPPEDRGRFVHIAVLSRE